MPQAARKSSSKAQTSSRERPREALNPILYEPKVKRVRIQFFEVAPNRTGELSKGKTHSLTYYKVGMDEAARIIKDAFARFAV